MESLYNKIYYTCNNKLIIIWCALMIWKLWYKILSTVCKCHYFNFLFTIFRIWSKINSYSIINFQWTLQHKTHVEGTHMVPTMFIVLTWLPIFGENLARPKFAILAFKSMSSKMLASLMSRCTIGGCTSWWRYLRPLAIPIHMFFWTGQSMLRSPLPSVLKTK